jgi:ribose-phosphate pyrophosphokinase
VHHVPVGKVQRCAVIVEDILDTGATLVSAGEKLVAAGAEKLYICVTHGLFTGKEWHNLWSSPVKHIFCTDTIRTCANIRDPRIIVLPPPRPFCARYCSRPVATQRRPRFLR